MMYQARLIVLAVLHHIGISLKVFPTGDGHNWIEIGLDELRCPQPSEPKEVAGVSHKVSTAVPHEREGGRYHTGYFCHGIIDYAVCYTSFFGTQQRDCHHSIWTPSDSDCQRAVDDYQVGSFKMDQCETYQCKWLERTALASKKIVIREVKLQADRYTESFMHPLFEEGTCKKSPCKTLEPSIIWIGPDYDPHEFCSVYYPPEESTLVLVENGTSYLSDLHYGPLPLEGACSVRYCGIEGVRFQNGVFISFNSTVWTTTPCSDEVQVGIIPEWMREESILELTYEELEYEICETTLGTIVGTGKVSWEQLSKFYPVSPGYHLAYRILPEGILEKDIIMFLPGFEHKNMTVVTDMEKTFDWHDWIETPTGLRGPSGILRTPAGVVITPHKRLHRSGFNMRDITPHLIFPPRHPSRFVIPEHKQDNFDPGQSMSDLSTYAPWENALFHFVRYGIPCIGGVVTIWILYKCGFQCKDGVHMYKTERDVGSRVVVNYNSKNAKHDDMELQNLRI